MRSILSFVLAALLWIAVAPTASAQESGLLVPCSESPEFQAREFLNTTADPESGQKRAERYGQALCGEEGLPHLIVDGRLDRAGDFIIPGLMFLYIAGWIGWVGRAYLIAIRGEKNPEEKEIVIDVSLAFNKMLGGFLWPVAAVQEFLSGELTAADGDIPVSPR